MALVFGRSSCGVLPSLFFASVLGPILIGAGLAATVGIVAVLAGSLSPCDPGYAPCGNYGICCKDLYKYCPSNNLCYRTIFDAQACPGSTVTCHN